jgi:rhodanese-related sulfurtransferase
MPNAPRALALRLLILAGMAAAAALISNTLASSARRLAWSGSVVVTPSVPPRVERPTPPEPSPQPRSPEAQKAVSPVPQASPRIPAPPPPKTSETMAAGPIREIGGPEVWKAFQSGVPFLDARRSAEFAEGHVTGAWSAPVWESDLEDRLITFKAARRPGSEDPIVIYCSGGDCRDSHLLAAKLLKEGYFHLLIYRDGFPDWVAQKRPIEKGQP